MTRKPLKPVKHWTWLPEGAKCLGYDDLGELREGWLADILIDRSGFNWKPDFIDVSITVYAANSRDVDTVIINGKPVMINKELLTIDTERLYFEVNPGSQRTLW